MLVLDKNERDCKLLLNQQSEEKMNIDRRQLVLPALAIGLLSIVPAIAASADEDAVAKSVEAFRAAQVATDAKAFEALCASELSYGHSDARIEDKATFIANATTIEKRNCCRLPTRIPKLVSSAMPQSCGSTG